MFVHIRIKFPESRHQCIRSLTNFICTTQHTTVVATPRAHCATRQFIALIGMSDQSFRIIKHSTCR